jgi:hypothetical protein
MPVAEVLLISEEKLKAYTTLNENLSPQILIPYVLQSQDTYLVNWIGSSFYKELKDQVRTNTVSVANAYILDEYIGPMLVQYAMASAIPFIKYRFVNKGILSPKSETADSIELEEVKYLVAEVKNYAQQYAFLLQRYLYFHSNDYPLWNSALAQDGVIPDKGSTFSAALVTPHMPYAFSKRLAERASRGQYGYSLDGAVMGQPGQYCDFPFWLWG